jgi:CYTH domain-containing protein
LALCEPGSIQKTRYLVPFKNQTFEVDVFAGDNTGLIVAEIELTHEDQVVEKPDWLGKEVTQESKYYNASLSKHPFMAWEQQSE